MRSTSLPIWLEATRPKTLPAAVAPVLVGSALAYHDGRFDPSAATLCLLFALLVQVATNFANDYYDYVKGADTVDRVGPRRAVAAGLIEPAIMKRAMMLTFAAAFVSGLSLIAWGGPWLIVVGVASIMCGAAYTGGPWPLGYNGLGDVFVFIFFGLVAVTITYFVQAGHVSREAWWVGAAVGGLAANILVVNNFRDVDTDRRAGKGTLVVRWGRTAARVQFAGALVLALTVPVILSLRGFTPWCLLPVLLAPVGFVHLRRLNERAAAPELIALLGQTGKFLAAYAVLLAVGVAVAV